MRRLQGGQEHCGVAWPAAADVVSDVQNQQQLGAIVRGQGGYGLGDGDRAALKIGPAVPDRRTDALSHLTRRSLVEWLTSTAMPIAAHRRTGNLPGSTRR